MCLIIHKPTADSVIPKHILDNAEDINPDGFGIVYTDNNECVRTMDYTKARELISAERPFVAHYRFATRGTINKQNCHPYFVENSDDYGLTRLFSNGTVANLGDDKLCDTKVVATLLKTVPYHLWDDFLSMTETRFAVCYDGGIERHGVWHEKDGIFYSKNNCFHTYTNTCGYGYSDNAQWKTPKNYGYKGFAKPLLTASSTELSWDNTNAYDDIYEDELDEEMDGNWDDIEFLEPTESSNEPSFDWKDNHLVAVYGTLKAGLSNHRLLSSALYRGAGATQEIYPMQTQGVPFVFDFAGIGFNITVEVYEVTSVKAKNSLDSLEGHPTTYERKLTNIKMKDGSLKTCWLYFGNDHFHADDMEYIQTY